MRWASIAPPAGFRTHWKLERPVRLLTLVFSQPVEVGIVGIQGASWSHSAVIGSIEHSIEHLEVRHYALDRKRYYFTYSAVHPTQGTVDEFYDYRTTATHHLVRFPILRYTICPLLWVWLWMHIHVCGWVVCLFACPLMWPHTSICHFFFLF